MVAASLGSFALFSPNFMPSAVWRLSRNFAALFAVDRGASRSAILALVSAAICHAESDSEREGCPEGSAQPPVSLSCAAAMNWIALGRPAHGLVAGHPVGFAKSDRRQRVREHFGRVAGREVAVGLLVRHQRLVLNQPVDGGGDLGLVRPSALVRLADAEEWQQGQRGRAGVRFPCAGIGVAFFAPAGGSNCQRPSAF